MTKLGCRLQQTLLVMSLDLQVFDKIRWKCEIFVTDYDARWWRHFRDHQRHSDSSSGNQEHLCKNCVAICTTDVSNVSPENKLQWRHGDARRRNPLGKSALLHRFDPQSIGYFNDQNCLQTRPRSVAKTPKTNTKRTLFCAVPPHCRMCHFPLPCGSIHAVSSHRIHNDTSTTKDGAVSIAARADEAAAVLTETTRLSCSYNTGCVNLYGFAAMSFLFVPIIVGSQRERERLRSSHYDNDLLTRVAQASTQLNKGWFNSFAWAVKQHEERMGLGFFL